MLVETSEVSVNPPPAVMSVPNGAPHEPAIYRTSQHDDPPDVPDVRPSGLQAVIKVIVGDAARARLHIQPITSEERSRRSEYVRGSSSTAQTETQFSAAHRLRGRRQVATELNC